MDWSLIAGFAAMAAVIELSPGPNFLLITRSVPSFGKAGAMANVAGFGCSYTMHGALAIYGISALLAAEPMLLLVIQLAGACFLLHLGIKSFTPKSGRTPTVELIAQPVDILLTPPTDSMVMKNNFALLWSRMSYVYSGCTSGLNSSIDIVLDEHHGKTQRADLLTCFKDGMVISALNPKISLFYMAAFPQFIHASNDTVASSFFLVFTHIAICALWANVVAIVLEYALKKAGSQYLVDKLNRFSGVALIGLSAAFFTSVARAF